MLNGSTDGLNTQLRLKIQEDLGGQEILHAEVFADCIKKLIQEKDEDKLQEKDAINLIADGFASLHLDKNAKRTEAEISARKVIIAEIINYLRDINKNNDDLTEEDEQYKEYKAQKLKGITEELDDIQGQLKKLTDALQNTTLSEPDQLKLKTLQDRNKDMLDKKNKLVEKNLVPINYYVRVGQGAKQVVDAVDITNTELLIAFRDELKRLIELDLIFKDTLQGFEKSFTTDIEGFLLKIEEGQLKTDIHTDPKREKRFNIFSYSVQKAESILDKVKKLKEEHKKQGFKAYKRKSELQPNESADTEQTAPKHTQSPIVPNLNDAEDAEQTAQKYTNAQSSIVSDLNDAKDAEQTAQKYTNAQSPIVPNLNDPKFNTKVYAEQTAQKYTNAQSPIVPNLNDPKFNTKVYTEQTAQKYTNAQSPIVPPKSQQKMTMSSITSRERSSSMERSSSGKRSSSMERSSSGKRSSSMERSSSRERSSSGKRSSSREVLSSRKRSSSRKVLSAIKIQKYWRRKLQQRLQQPKSKSNHATKL